ncbi:MAG: type I restriction enzyme HsdR N-terminal domain-containing protein [bacterium]|nr:type I restriction enzyme HsdR N-terminal domain-containing protein [bacterium]
MFREEIKEHATRASGLVQEYPEIKNSEAQTKNSLIEPLLQCLGYDPSHPEQVTLEVSTQLGGKIDYVLTGQANVKVAVEAKRAGVKLSEKETNQLRSYFTFSEVIAGILTNGVIYWLFTDLDKTNVMDATPYHSTDLRHLTENDVHHLETLTRSLVQQGTIHEQARRERYRTRVNEIVTQELHSPSQELLRLIGRRLGIKPLTKSHLKLLAPLVDEAISHSRGTAPLDNLSPASPPLIPGSKLPTSAPQPPPAEPPVVVPADPAGLTPGKKAALTKARFKGATLFGKSLTVGSYREMLTSVVAELQSRHPNNFADKVSNKPFVKDSRKHQYISRNEKDFHPSAAKYQLGDYWIDTHLDRKDTVKRARLFLREFGHDPDELVIHTSND